MHTNDTSQTISRILDIFPAGHQSQIRQQLSLALLAIVTQQLVPAADSANRYPAVEILMATNAIRNLIRTGQDHRDYRSHISTGRIRGHDDHGAIVGRAGWFRAHHPRYGLLSLLQLP